MRDRLVATLALSGAMAGLLSGCVSNPNAMVFGTNTVLGISAGASATNSPSVTVGYKRQEAVVMPLVANVSMNGEVLTACNMGGVKPDEKHPCLLTGTQTNGQNRGQTDSLSVLASFGTEYGATSNNPQVKGKISQYFATGLAARILAEQAGAGAVAVGPAVTAAAVGALQEAQASFTVQIADKVAATADARLAQYLAEMDTAAGTDAFSAICRGEQVATECAKLIKADSGRRLAGVLPEDFAEALKVPNA